MAKAKGTPKHIYNYKLSSSSKKKKSKVKKVPDFKKIHARNDAQAKSIGDKTRSIVRGMKPALPSKLPQQPNKSEEAAKP